MMTRRSGGTAGRGFDGGLPGDGTGLTAPAHVEGRDVLRRLRANGAVLIAAIERRYAVIVLPTADGRHDGLGRRLRRLRRSGLIDRRYAAAMCAVPEPRCDIDYRGIMPAPAGRAGMALERRESGENPSRVPSSPSSRMPSDMVSDRCVQPDPSRVPDMRSAHTQGSLIQHREPGGASEGAVTALARSPLPPAPSSRRPRR